MFGVRLPAAFFATVLLSVSNHRHELPSDDILQGVWEVIEIRRDGVRDRLQVGAQLTFSGNRVWASLNPYIFDFDIGDAVPNALDFVQQAKLPTWVS